jgi:hypothetical protein
MAARVWSGMRCGATLSAAAAVSLFARDGHGSPPDTYGLGARSTALGGAVSASVSDYSAGYYNPAGLAQGGGSELSLGYLYASHRLELSGHDSMVDPVRGFVGGLVARGAVARAPVAVGLTAHVSDERLSRLRTRRPEEPYWVRYDDRPQLLYLSLSAALQPRPGAGSASPGRPCSQTAAIGRKRTRGSTMRLSWT